MQYFHKWSGLDSEHIGERQQIKKLSKILKSWAEETQTNTHLLTNFVYNAEEIDVAILLPHHIILYDLKTGGGIIKGQENGDWKATTKPIKKNTRPFSRIINKDGKKNPLRQAEAKKWAFVKFLNDNKKRIFPAKKLTKMHNAIAVKSQIVFSKPVEWDKNQIPEGTTQTHKWFDVYSLDDVLDKITEIVKDEGKWQTFGKTKAKGQNHFTEEEQWSIPTLLSLKNDILEEEKNIDEIPRFKNSEVLLRLPKQSISDFNYKGTLIRSRLISIDDDISITVEDEEGKRLKVHLNNHFIDTIYHLKKLSKLDKQINKKDIDINLVNVRKKGNDVYFEEKLESLLVLEPEWLINVTTLASLDFCPRQLFNARYGLQQRFDAMTKGSIIHEVFEDIMQDPDDYERLNNQLNDSLMKRSFEFALDNIDYEKMEEEMRPHLNRLYKYRKENDLISNITNVNTERFIINPVLGLKGKIDAVVVDKDGQRALELKSSKKKWAWVDGRPTNYITPGHKSQVQAYSLLMEMKSETSVLNPIVVYSGEPIEGKNIGEEVEFTYSNKTENMIKRNQLVLADYLLNIEYEKQNKNKCSKCSQKEICENLFSLEIKHDPNNLPIYYSEQSKDDILPEFSKDEKEFFNKYNRLLTEEYRIDKEAQGTYLLKNRAERIQLGKTIIIDAYQESGINEYLLNTDNNSELREGDRCLLSDKNGPIHGECLEATIIKVSRSSIHISTRAKIEFKPVYLDFYPQENVFARNYPMVYELVANNENKKLKNLIINKDNPKPNKKIEISQIGTLHEKQMLAIQYALGIEDYLLIQGPPGTGKTLTIAHIVEQLVKDNRKVIIGCYTHRAVDEVIKKLRDNTSFDFPIYRIGEGSSDDINEYSIENVLNKNGDIDSRISSAENIISQNGVYIATTHKWLSGGFDSLVQKNGSYDVAIIDEASQVIVPNAIGALRLAKKFILVGDHRQLPPVVQSEEAKDLTKTLFEMLYNNKDAHKSTRVMLDIQHRMPQQISDFISSEFYNKELVAAKEVSENLFKIKMEDSKYDSIINSNKSIELYNIKSIKNVKNQSIEEAKIIKEILGDLLKAGVNYHEIGIIAPFRAQVAEIRRQIELDLIKYFEDPSDIKNIIDTVDRFQGDERDLILFSLTITGDSIPKLLEDKRRLNVAISRAKKKFIAIGNWEKAVKSDTLKHLKEYCEK